MWPDTILHTLQLCTAAHRALIVISVAEEETAPVQFTVLPNFTLLPATTTEAAETATPAVTAGTTQQATTTTSATTTTVKTDTIKDRRNNFFRKKAPRRFNFRRRPVLRKLVPAVEEEDAINEVEPAVSRPAVRPPPVLLPRLQVLSPAMQCNCWSNCRSCGGAVLRQVPVSALSAILSSFLSNKTY